MTEGFQAWNAVYPSGVHAGVERPILPGSVFLYEEIRLQHFQKWPSGWDWFDSPRELAGYLLHVGLPDLAGWWFDDSDTVGGPPKRLPLRETVGWATDGDAADRAFFLSLADDLDIVLAGPDSVTFDAVSVIVDRLSTHFADMTLTAYPDAVAAGAALLDLQDGPPDLADVDDGAEWLQLCADAGTDPAATTKVAESFWDANSV